jgi:hypothetical protein
VLANTSAIAFEQLAYAFGTIYVSTRLARNFSSRGEPHNEFD